MTTVTPTAVPTDPVPPAALEALRTELVDLLGERGVSADERTRTRASVDEATMSPILSEQLPLGLADLVASPRAPTRSPPPCRPPSDTASP